MELKLIINTGKRKYSEKALDKIDSELKKILKSLVRRKWKVKSKGYWGTRAEAVLRK